MAETNYSKSSPYFGTDKFGNFLDVMAKRSIPAYPDDVQYTIDKAYRHRPDLLAFDLYGDAALWWVFAIRNPNTLKDPLGDFIPGVTISIPKKNNIVTVLGL
jgi:hypothetical protein